MATVRLTIMGLSYFICSVMEVFANNISKLQKLLFSIVENIDEEKTCQCDNVARW